MKHKDKQRRVCVDDSGMSSFRPCLVKKAWKISTLPWSPSGGPNPWSPRWPVLHWHQGMHWYWWRWISNFTNRNWKARLQYCTPSQGLAKDVFDNVEDTSILSSHHGENEKPKYARVYGIWIEEHAVLWPIPSSIDVLTVNGHLTSMNDWCTIFNAVRPRI